MMSTMKPKVTFLGNMASVVRVMLSAHSGCILNVTSLIGVRLRAHGGCFQRDVTSRCDCTRRVLSLCDVSEFYDNDPQLGFTLSKLAAKSLDIYEMSKVSLSSFVFL